MNVMEFHLNLTRTCRKMYSSKEFHSFYLLFVLFGFFISETHSEKDITINIPPRKEECFYESIKSGQVIDIDYQVIDGHRGPYDISFYILSPVGRALVMDFKKSEKSHRIEVDDEGDYKLCFDNRYSTFHQKTVYFELIIEAEDGSDVDLQDPISPYTSPEDQYEIAIKDIEETVKRVKSHLMKIRHMQEAVRVLATKDKNILETNYSRVNIWSILQIIVMVTVGLMQVSMIKSLLDEQSKIHKVWKKTHT